MRIQIMSDIHVRHWINKLGVQDWLEDFPKATQTDADVLVVAGDAVEWDVRRWRWSMDRMQELCVRYKQVVYVPGNHEYYGSGIWDVQEDLCEIEGQIGNLHILWPGHTATIDGQRFIGGTMFQPWDESPWITDHYIIYDFKPEAEKHYNELRLELVTKLTKDDIVVTHHAPHRGSIDAQFAGDKCNRWFITPEMEPLIWEKQPKLWIHGHVHNSFDYLYGETRIIANPRGYVGENAAFNPKLIVEV